MKAQQPHKNTVQLVALATTAAPSTWQNIMFWNINGAAKHLIMTWHNTPPAAGGVLGQAHRHRWGRWAGGAGGVLDYTGDRCQSVR